MNKYKISKYHYFYKITNTINGHFYYGVHSTDDINDGYMGSGKRLHYAYKKYGIENFVKEILKYFNTAAEAYKYEAEVVTEDLININECYNICTGGAGGSTCYGKVSVKDDNNNTFIVDITDERYLSGELVPIQKGFVLAKDLSGKIYRVPINDERYLSGELVSFQKERSMYVDNTGCVYNASIYDERVLSGQLVPIQKGFVNVKTEDGKYKRIKKENYDSEKYIHPTKGRITVKDKHGKFYSVYKNDPRYISGELKPNCCGHILSDETKKKISEHMPDISGEKNHNYGKIWIHKNFENKLINKTELQHYNNNGWEKGRFLEKDKNGKIKKKNPTWQIK